MLMRMPPLLGAPLLGPALVAAILVTAQASAEALSVVGRYDWQTEQVAGVSGLEVQPDGLGFTAVTDSGWYLQGSFRRDDGQLSGVALDAVLPIKGDDGLPVAARRVEDRADAEGLAMGPDGRHWVSFERWSHVSGFQSVGGTAEWIADHPDFATQADNRQLEALALHPGGSLYTLPERAEGDGFPLYQRAPGQDWQHVGHIPDVDGFAVTGADFDADGMLYLLERKLVVGLWWQSRIRRLRIETPGSVEILWTSTRGDYGNLEGLSVWRAPDGLRLTAVSDNNGKQDVPTQFVEFLLGE